MKKILVTGGLGYIGSHTALSLIEKGYDPILLDNLSNSEQFIVDRLESLSKKKIKFYNSDLSDELALNQIFSDNEIDSVIHFAAFKAVGESVANPIKYFSNNINSLSSLIKVMNNNKCKKIIFSSSCTVYGEPKKIPVDEKAKIQKAHSPYGETKQICESMLEHSASAYDLKVISLRYFNPIGAHDSGVIGELPIGTPQNLIPFICQVAAGIRDKLLVWGKDYDTYDGTAIRDYIDINDLADAHVISLAKHDALEDNFNVFNLGSGSGTSVLEIIETFEKVNGVKVNYEYADRRLGDVEKIYCDPSKANRLLNWNTKRSLEESLKTAWRWQENLL